MQLMVTSPPGMLIYFQDHEAGGLGSIGKTKLLEAEEETGLSFPALAAKWNIENMDVIVLGVVPALVEDQNFLGTAKIVTNNPRKMDRLSKLGLKISSCHGLDVDASLLSDRANLEMRDKAMLYGPTNW
jgi:hypothetical protein